MLPNGKLLAWIELRDDEEFLAAFVGEAAADVRAPATQLCSSHSGARQWIENQAAAFGLPIKWVTKPPKR
jgi:hypothetical protein